MIVASVKHFEAVAHDVVHLGEDDEGSGVDRGDDLLESCHLPGGHRADQGLVPLPAVPAAGGNAGDAPVQIGQEPLGDLLAFAGDGINDAPVLTRADLGIAMGAMGSDAAIEAADIVLMDDNPLKIAKAIRISRKCMRIVRQNIVFALAVKAICLVLGALGIANMWLAVFADVGVMILAVLNAIRALFTNRL